MIVLPVIGMFLAGAAQVERPSVLPPLATRPHGDPARAAGIAAADAGCAVKGVVPGRPVPARLRRAAPAPARIRILHPGDQATMDFLPDRRNIHVDRDGKVLRVTCG